MVRSENQARSSSFHPIDIIGNLLADQVFIIALEDAGVQAANISQAVPILLGKYKGIVILCFSLHGIDRVKACIDDERLTGILLAGEDQAESWLRVAMRDGVPIDALRRWLFAPRAEPPVAAAAPRKVICNCLDVSEADIKRELAAGADLTALQDKLKCGTSCGSCVPEIKRMLAVPQTV